MYSCKKDCGFFTNGFYIFLLLCVIQTAKGCTAVNFPTTLNATETDAIGTIIWQYDTTVTSTDTWNINIIGDFLGLNVTNSSYSVYVTKHLELDNLDVKGCILPDTVLVSFTCETDPTATKESSLQIHPVNEYPPEIIGAPFNFNVSENDPVGTNMFEFNRRVTDKDCPYIPDFVYKFVPYELDAFDIKDFFDINETTGVISKSKAIDADEFRCTSGLDHYVLKFSVGDNDPVNPLSSTNLINIWINDVDDEPPVFVNSPSCVECDKSCEVSSIEINVSTLDEGILEDKLYAKDYDTKSSDIIFSLLEAAPQNISFLVDLSEDGNLTIPKAAANYTNYTFSEDFTLTFIVQAIENRTQQISDNFTLKIVFVVPVTTSTEETTTEIATTEQGTTILTQTTEINTAAPSTTMSPTTISVKLTEPTNQVSGQATDILIIVLPTVFGVLLVVMIAAIIYQQRKNVARKWRKYVVQNGQPQTVENGGHPLEEHNNHLYATVQKRNSSENE